MFSLFWDGLEYMHKMLNRGEGKTKKPDFTYGFIGEARPWCVCGWDGGVLEIGSCACVASVGS
jgi:hypothetical protein